MLGAVFPLGLAGSSFSRGLHGGSHCALFEPELFPDAGSGFGWGAVFGVVFPLVSGPFELSETGAAGACFGAGAGAGAVLPLAAGAVLAGGVLAGGVSVGAPGHPDGTGCAEQFGAADAVESTALFAGAGFLTGRADAASVLAGGVVVGAGLPPPHTAPQSPGEPPPGSGAASRTSVWGPTEGNGATSATVLTAAESTRTPVEDADGSGAVPGASATAVPEPTPCVSAALPGISHAPSTHASATPPSNTVTARAASSDRTRDNTGETAHTRRPPGETTDSITTAPQTLKKIGKIRRTRPKRPGRAVPDAPKERPVHTYRGHVTRWPSPKRRALRYDGQTITTSGGDSVQRTRGRHERKPRPAIYPAAACPRGVAPGEHSGTLCRSAARAVGATNQVPTGRARAARVT